MNLPYLLLESVLPHTSVIEHAVDLDDNDRITDVNWAKLLHPGTLNMLSGGERTMVLLAHDLFSDGNKVPLLEVVRRLDVDRLVLVLAVMCQQRDISPHWIDDELQRMRVRT